jgi:hypothetical protein
MIKLEFLFWIKIAWPNEISSDDKRRAYGLQKNRAAGPF